jgi:hypothetical protein
MVTDLTQEDLREQLHYEQDDGTFKWKVSKYHFYSFSLIPYRLSYPFLLLQSEPRLHNPL